MHQPATALKSPNYYYRGPSRAAETGRGTAGVVMWQLAEDLLGTLGILSDQHIPRMLDQMENLRNFKS